MKKNKYIIYLFVIIYIIFTFNTLSLANNKNTTEVVEKINNIEDNRVEDEKNTDENLNYRNQNKESSKKISEVQAIANGIYEIGVGQNKVIEVKNSYKYSGANVQLFTKNNTVNQKVSVKYMGEGYYTIKFIHSEMYLDVANGEKKNGTNVWQCRENGSDAQKWIIRKNEEGKYNIISKCSNTYLTVENGKFENGTNIEINEKKNDNSQNFIFYKCEEEKGNKTIENGIYEIGIGVNSNKVLEVSNSYKYSGANVQIYEKNNAKSQKVQITYIGDGYYTIKFMHSEMYLDVANGEIKNGTNVWQCRENGSDAKKWIIRKNERGKYNIISKCSNTYLTVENGKDENGTNIEINGKKADNSQEFVFYKYTEKKESKTINSGVYEIGITTDSSKVVEVANAYKYSGANVRIYTRNKGLSQKVKIVYIGDGYYTIKFMHSGMYLDVANGEIKNGTNVWQCRENGSDAQKWIIRKNERGKYNIISKCSNTYLTIENGTNIEINEKKNDDSQDFIFNEYKEEKGSKTIENGIYEIKEGKDLNKVIEVANTYKYSGANVQIYEKNNAKSQKVQITYIGDGYYTIKFMHSGMYLDVANGETKNGTNVWQCRENGSDAQKWIIRKNERGKYNIISKCSNTYLTIENGKDENGTNIEINEKKNDDSQYFIFNEYKEEQGSKTIESGIYEIEYVSTKVIDVLDASILSGANVQLYERNYGLCQRVEIKYVGDGYYTIKFMHSGMYLDVADGKTNNGTNVWQCRENGSDAQKWIIRKNESGDYNIISKCSNTYLTVENGKDENGANIEINEKKNNKSQNFKLNNKTELKGIDVSSHQGNIQWENVKQSNIDFAIIRCGYGQDLLNQDDKKFTRNISECERLGIPYGVYIYSYALDETAALSEANHVLRLISGHNPKLGIWFDMEDADGYKRKNGMPSNEKLVNICITFCEKIKQEGYNVGIYASLSWLRNQLNDSKLDVYDKWVAQWAIGCTYNKRYVMWQYTDKGTVEGIDGYVDMNKYYM